MKFSAPLWLVVGLLTCLLLVWIWRRYDARQRAALANFVAPQLRIQLTRSMSILRRRVQRLAVLAAFACLCAALAGPLVGYRWENINRRGNEIVFAIDTSRSMLTPDVKPNRLVRAKLAIDDFAHQLDGDAVGIVAFAGSSFLVCPLTLDYGAFHESLDTIDTQTIPRGGTNISRAILESQVALRRRPGTDRIMILVTDGEDLEGDALAAARAAVRQDGVKIYTVGVGSAAGDLIPIPSDQGGGFVKDETGAFVKSRLDEAALKALAAATGGFYVPLGTQGEGLETIRRAVLGGLTKHDLAFRQQRVYIERFQWPLAGALGFLLASLLVGTRRRPAVRAAQVSGIVLLSSLMGLLFDPLARSDAAESSEKPRVEFNSGAAAYRAGQFPQAAQDFQRSIMQAPSSEPQRLADQQDSYYNLGNTLYRAGQATQQSAPQETLKKWEQAVKAYETALQLRPDDVDSKYNRDFVKRKIDALKQPPPQGQGKGQGQGQGQGKGQGQGAGEPPKGPPPAQPPPPPPQPQQQPPPQQPRSQPPPQPQPQQQQQPGQPPPAANSPAQGQAADERRAPGQMSPEEARELLDSVKGDERHALGAPLARRPDEPPPDKPLKNW